jgi:rod shape determining protein RodA
MRKFFGRVLESYSLKNSGEEGGIDWILFLATLPLLGAGLVTMNSFNTDSSFFSGFFAKQLIWIVISITIFFVLSFIDFRFLRKTWISVTLFISSCGLLLTLFAVGKVAKGALSWFDLGLFSVQPSDPIKLVLIIILAKYFSRRHIEIANLRHIFVSGLYAFIIFILVLVQPDFGSAVIIFFIWFGMILTSGLSRKHLLGLIIVGALVFALLWNFGFKDYQKARILTFINPGADIHGTGYNSYQSTIAVGSGELWGKGVGYGTQSRLKFLPEYQTDFIFSAFAEEWGFIGVAILFSLFALVIWRIIKASMRGATNFEILFGSGVAILIIVHFVINIGMNIQLLPVTGTTLPFLSYGGTHLVTEFAGLGILMGMRRYRRVAHKDEAKNEFIGA